MILSYLRRLLRPWDVPGRYASLYQREGKIYLAPQYRTRKGQLYDVRPVTVVDASDLAAVARAIEKSLGLSRLNVPNLDQRTRAANGNPVREAAGGMEWPDFVRGTKHIAIRDEGNLRLLPFENKGVQHGFVASSKSTIQVKDEPDLHVALLEALERALAG